MLRVLALFILFFYAATTAVFASASEPIVNGRICQSILSRTPVGGENGSSFELKEGTVVLWTQLKNIQAGSIRHVWYFEGKALDAITLKLVPPLNRVYSKKKVWNSGNYRVEVLGQDNTVLKTFQFRIVQSGKTRTVEPDQSVAAVQEPRDPAQSPESSPQMSDAQAPKPLPDLNASQTPGPETPQSAVPPLTETKSPPASEPPVSEPPTVQVSQPPPPEVPDPQAATPPPPPAPPEPSLLLVKNSFADGLYPWAFRINGVAPGLSWSPFYRSGIYGVRLNIGGHSQRGKTAMNYEVFWMWRLLPRLDLELGGGTQNWNDQSNSMMSAYLSLDLEAGQKYGLYKVFIGYSKVDVPLDSLRVISAGIEFNF